MKIIINASWTKKVRKVLEVNNMLFKNNKIKKVFIEDIKKTFPKGAKVNIKIVEK